MPPQLNRMFERRTAMSLRKVALGATVVLALAGCVAVAHDAPQSTSAPQPTTAPVVQPTPQIVYVTPAPVPTEKPTPKPTDTPKPVKPTPSGDDFMTFLTWAQTSTQRWVDLFNEPMNTVAQIKRIGDDGVDLATSDLAWLHSHDAQSCYADLFDEYVHLSEVRLDAMQATANFSASGPSKIDDASAETQIATGMLDTAGAACIADL